MENIGLFCGHLVYLAAICFILLLVCIFFRFGKLFQEKSGNLDTLNKIRLYQELNPLKTAQTADVLCLCRCLAL
jgi:hypothetical protein